MPSLYHHRSCFLQSNSHITHTDGSTVKNAIFSKVKKTQKHLRKSRIGKLSYTFFVQTTLQTPRSKLDKYINEVYDVTNSIERKPKSFEVGLNICIKKKSCQHCRMDVVLINA